ncbi:MAG: UPF0175 family protein [bacterium]
MKTLQVNLPETIDISDRELKMFLASKLYELGKLTIGQAAVIAGLSKKTFMELLSKYDVDLINSSESDLDSDIDNARNYSI